MLGREGGGEDSGENHKKQSSDGEAYSLKCSPDPSVTLTHAGQPDGVRASMKHWNQDTGSRIFTMIYVDIKKCGPVAAKPAGGAGRWMPASSLLHLLSLALSVHLNLTLVTQTPWKMSRSWATTMAPGPSDYAPALNCHGNGMVNFTRCHCLSDHGWSFTATSVAPASVDTVTSLSHLRRDTDSDLRHITMATQKPAGCFK